MHNPLSHFKSVLSYPSLCCLCGHTLDIFLSIRRILAAVGVEEVITGLGNVESLLIAVCITEATYGKLLNYLGLLGIVLFLADNLFHFHTTFLFNFLDIAATRSAKGSSVALSKFKTATLYHILFKNAIGKLNIYKKRRFRPYRRHGK